MSAVGSSYSFVILCSCLARTIAQVGVAIPVDMQPPSEELWRTQLCAHGPHHLMPGCRFAHSLSQLCAPDERINSYGQRWREHAVDRFYGQEMSRDQIRRICRYYCHEEFCDLPLWSHALRVLDQGIEGHCGYAFPWDFGLSRDYDDLLDRRLRRQCPFQGYPFLWARLGRRRELLIRYDYPVHPLLIMPPLPAPQVPMAPPPPRGPPPADQEPMPDFRVGEAGRTGRRDAGDAMRNVGMDGNGPIGGGARPEEEVTMPASSSPGAATPPPDQGCAMRSDESIDPDADAGGGAVAPMYSVSASAGGPDDSMPSCPLGSPEPSQVPSSLFSMQADAGSS